MPNPYFDDTDGSDTSTSPPPNPSLPAWASITSDLVSGPDEDEELYEPMPTPVVNPIPAPISPTTPSAPTPQRPTTAAPQGFAPVASPVPAAPAPVPMPVPMTPPPPAASPPNLDEEPPAPSASPSYPSDVPVPPDASTSFSETQYSQPTQEDYDPMPPLPPVEVQDVPTPPPMAPQERKIQSDDPWSDEEDVIRPKRTPKSLTPSGSPDSASRTRTEPSRRPSPRSKQGSSAKSKSRPTRDPRQRTKPTSRNKKPSSQPQEKKKGFSLISSKSKKSSRESTEKSSGRWGGARVGVLVLKTTIWVALAVFLINGIRVTFSPPSISVTAVTNAVAERIGIVDYPIVAAEPLAESFARAYLNNPPGLAAQRAADIERFLPRNQFSQSNASFPVQELLAGPYLIDQPEILDDNRAIFTFRAQILREVDQTNASGDIVPRWIFLSVPVFADNNGAVRISGLPAFVPGPKASEESTKLNYPRASSEVSDVVATDLKVFFTAWGKGDTATLQRFASPSSSVKTSPAVTTGLGSARGGSLVQFLEISDISVEAYDATTQKPILTQVKVVWNDNGVKIEQSYLLTLLYNDGKAWYVQDIQGGSFLG